MKRATHCCERRAKAAWAYAGRIHRYSRVGPDARRDASEKFRVGKHERHPGLNAEGEKTPPWRLLRHSHWLQSTPP